MNRRTFLRSLAELGGSVVASPVLAAAARTTLTDPVRSRVAFVKTTDRAAGVNRAIDLLGVNSWKGKDLFVKPNFNSADAPPGSTHNETLAALVRALRRGGAGAITVGDRSGMGNTRQVMESKNIFALARELGAKALVLDELPADQWRTFAPQNSHWSRGFALPKPALDGVGLVQTCCLKTHRFGGHFTLSLKNSVGLAAKFLPGDSYNFMSELHGSPHQRRMIAEINAAYQPDLVVLDGVEAFATGGPEAGKLVNAQVVLAGTDRVAIDAVGVALLRRYGTTPEVAAGSIFEQDQLKRAIELGLGAEGPHQIEIVTADRDSADYAQEIRGLLAAGARS